MSKTRQVQKSVRRSPRPWGYDRVKHHQRSKMMTTAAAGAASDVLVRNLLNGAPLLTKIDVHTGGLIYSLAYQF